MLESSQSDGIDLTQEIFHELFNRNPIINTNYTSSICYINT